MNLLISWFNVNYGFATSLLAMLNFGVAFLMWRTTQKATKAAVHSAEIAAKQVEGASKIQIQNTSLLLLKDRSCVYDQLLEWISYAEELGVGNRLHSDSLKRFYCMVNRKTKFVPLNANDYLDLQIDQILIRLNTECEKILMADLLFESVQAAEYFKIKDFTENFMKLILNIEFEIFRDKGPYLYTEILSKSVCTIRDAGILENMRKEMQPINVEVC